MTNFKNFVIYINCFLFQLHIKLLKDGMKIETRHVRRKQLTQYIDSNLLKRERKLSETSIPAGNQIVSRKRTSTEVHHGKKGRMLHESVS